MNSNSSKLLTESTLSGSTPIQPLSFALWIRLVTPANTFALHFAEWMSNHHSFQSSILFTVVVHPFLPTLAPGPQKHDGSKSAESSLYQQVSAQSPPDRT